jgi:pyruvate,water dikinase
MALRVSSLISSSVRVAAPYSCKNGLSKLVLSRPLSEGSKKNQRKFQDISTVSSGFYKKKTYRKMGFPFGMFIPRFLHVQRVVNSLLELNPDDGAVDLLDQQQFNDFAVSNDIPGASANGTIKFLMTGVDTDTPRVYFINTNKYHNHFDFVEKALKLPIDNGEFNQQTYFTDKRKFLAGAIVSYDNYTSSEGHKGAYVFEFWPTDPVQAKFVSCAFKQISLHMKFAQDFLYYHPAGDTHEELYEEEKEQYQQLQIPVLQTDVLFQNMSYVPMNLGQGYGYLRLANPAEATHYSVRDVIIFKSIPNELSHVAGIITEVPQTPLSHINLKARQNKTPNAYLKNASSLPDVEHLVGKPVFYKVEPENISLRPATDEEIEAYLDKIRPPTMTFPRRDLSRKEITSLDSVSHTDLQVFGAKAANVGEMRTFLGNDVIVPAGFAIPFYFYDAFMKKTGLYDQARVMIEDDNFKKSPEKREKALKAFQKTIKKAKMPASLEVSLSKMQQNFPQGISIRCRSSTNNEDLVEFNGAGLYDSYSHHPDEGSISKTVKKVFSSLWNFRAYEEREFYRIDHFTAAMAILVHPSFHQELANGVAVTKNPYDPIWDGSYINVQVGEGLVTNPDPGARPDEILLMKTAVSADGSKEKIETMFIRHSSLLPKGKKVLSPEQTDLLFEKLFLIQKHFLTVYDNKPGFAMDVEFKIDKEGRLAIKQARPWVD